MKVLTFSTLYPNAARPAHGVFVETRLRQLLASGEIQSSVVAPVPWFPFTHPAFGAYAAQARAPRAETRNGIDVLHPRFPVLPKIGMTLAPFLLYRAVRPLVERVRRERGFDLIDAHYFYPDGVAAAMLARRSRCSGGHHGARQRRQPDRAIPLSASHDPLGRAPGSRGDHGFTGAQGQAGGARRRARAHSRAAQRRGPRAFPRG